MFQLCDSAAYISVSTSTFWTYTSLTNRGTQATTTTTPIATKIFSRRALMCGSLVMSQRSEQPSRPHDHDEQIKRVDAEVFQRRRQNERTAGLHQPNENACREGAKHAAKSAERDRDVGDQREGRANVRVNVKEDREHRAGQPDQR